MNKFNDLYNLLMEDIKKAYRMYGLADFKFPKYRFSNVNVGDKLIYVYTSNYGFSGNWQIPYWTVNAEVVEVIEVLSNAFKLNNNMIVNKANSSTIETYTDTIEVRSGAVDTYDFHTPQSYTTEKQTRRYGKGVYPASFLLKYYDNHEKGYSLIGGGGSYEGIDYDSLKEIALTESTVQKMKAKRSENVDQITPTEKDIQRILDMLNQLKVTIQMDSGNYSYDTSHNSYIRNIIKKEFIALKAFKFIKRMNYTTHLYHGPEVKTKASKMLKLIKDYDKLIRRMKAIPIAFERFKANNKILSNPRRFCLGNENCNLTEQDFPEVSEFKSAAKEAYKENPRIVNRVLNDLTVYCDNFALESFNVLQKEITEMYENRLKQLNNILN